MNDNTNTYTPPIAAPFVPVRKAYREELHTNSKRAVRRGLNRYLDALGNLCFREVNSVQVFRDDIDGHDLPKIYPPNILRAFRSRYAPHVGAKQLARRAA